MHDGMQYEMIQGQGQGHIHDKALWWIDSTRMHQASRPVLAKVFLDSQQQAMTVNLCDLITALFARHVPHLTPRPASAASSSSSYESISSVPLN